MKIRCVICLFIFLAYAPFLASNTKMISETANQDTSSITIHKGNTLSLDSDLNLIWQDEFEGVELDRDKWDFQIGNGVNGWGNNELQFYTSRPGDHASVIRHMTKHR